MAGVLDLAWSPDEARTMRDAVLSPAHLAGSFLTLALVAGSTRAVVLVVHATNGPFTTIQGAVDAALVGDTILVKPGSYIAFLVDAKELTIAGDSGGPVPVSGASAVRELPAGSRVVVSGLTIAVPESWTYAPDYYEAGLSLVDNVGEVRVDACSLTGMSNTTWGGEGGAGAWIHGNAGSVALVGCVATGGRGENRTMWDGPGYTATGGAGIDVQNTRVAVYDGTLTGGRGGDGFDYASWGPMARSCARRPRSRVSSPRARCSRVVAEVTTGRTP